MIAATADAATRIGSCLAEASREGTAAWLPGVGAIACREAWTRLARDVGIAPDDYGTARVRAGEAGAARTVCRELAAPASFGRASPILIEALGPAVAARYRDLGLDLASASDAGSAGVARRLEEAMGRLAAVPSLARAIGAVLAVIHVAVPEGPDYDVGYSDPEVPFSVWVGIAGGGGPVPALRLAEGLLHECMHLQLSLIEACVPLVRADAGKLPSPWRDEPRPVGGVLHGTYVFAVVREFMLALRDAGPFSGEERRHVEDRIDSSGDELAAALAYLKPGDGLTLAGRHVVDLVSRSTARTSPPSSEV